MTYDFYADSKDKINILQFIFGETDLQIFDTASPYGKEISRYSSAAEIESKFDLENGDKFALTFHLWSLRHGGKTLFRRIQLDPKSCNGHLFRYSTDGWGLIQLYFGGIKNNELHQSHIGHFTKTGALKNEGSNSFNGPVDAWDWKEIQKSSRHISNHINNKLAVRKIGSFGVLAGADKLGKSGIALN